MTHRVNTPNSPCRGERRCRVRSKRSSEPPRSAQARRRRTVREREHPRPVSAQHVAQLHACRRRQRETRRSPDPSPPRPAFYAPDSPATVRRGGRRVCISGTPAGSRSLGPPPRSRPARRGGRRCARCRRRPALGARLESGGRTPCLVRRAGGVAGAPVNQRLGFVGPPHISRDCSSRRAMRTVRRSAASSRRCSSRPLANRLTHSAWRASTASRRASPSAVGCTSCER
jgi:hypothetical protein